MENQPSRPRLKADDILIHPEPQPCIECQIPTYFAILQPWIVKALCPTHLFPHLYPQSYARLQRILWDVIYQHTGNGLFEPQRAYWETLPEAERWEKVGRSIHERASQSADNAVSSMERPKTVDQSLPPTQPQRKKRSPISLKAEVECKTPRKQDL